MVLRSRNARTSAHPATQLPPTPPTPPADQAVLPAPPPKAAEGRPAGATAVLECTRAAGIDVSALSMADRTVELPLNSLVEIGKQKQASFLTKLLEKEPSWLNFISRRHCHAYLSHEGQAAQGMLDLTIENVSS